MSLIHRLTTQFDVIETSDPDEYRICCPYCGDQGKMPDDKYHLYVNLAKQVFICHRCGTKGSSERLIGAQEQTTTQNENWYEELLEQMEKEPEREVNTSPISVKIPKFKYVVKGSLAESYLSKRGILTKDIAAYGIRDWFSQQRLIIPTVRDEVTEFWVARSYIEEQPKYLNPSQKHYGGSLRRNCLFGYDVAKNFDHVIICEGVFSAMATGRNAVATFGKMITAQQVRLLVGMHTKRLTVAFDADAESESMALAGLLKNKTTATVDVIDWATAGHSGDADPADIGSKAMVELCRQAKPYDWYSLVSSLME